MGKVWGSSLQRNTPLRAKKPWDRSGKQSGEKKAKTVKKSAGMKRVGKRTAEWDRVRAKMKPEFVRAGITTCELRMQGCANGDMLSFAHSKKRRNIVGNELEECCVACLPCHDKIEILPEAEMTVIVRGIIADRETPVRSVVEESSI